MQPKEAEKIFKALANRRRLAIVKALSSKGRLRVSDIAEEINLSYKATSKHLQILKQVGFAEDEQIGLEQYYSLTAPQHSTLKHALSVL
jgi:DNA-binding transcriptional ArsR family regulator